MRATIIAVLMAAGLGLAGTATVSAAPISGAGLNNQDSNITQVQHWRWGSRRGWRGGYRCHRRGWSRSYRC